MNDVETCVLKIPKGDLSRLSKDEAIEMALRQESVQSELSSSSIIDVSYTAPEEYDSTVNIRVDKPIVRVSKSVKKKKVRN